MNSDDRTETFDDKSHLTTKIIIESANICEPFNLFVNSEKMTTSELKQMIAERLSIHTRIDQSELRLVFQGRVLKNEFSTLLSQGISKNDSKLYVSIMKSSAPHINTAQLSNENEHSDDSQGKKFPTDQLIKILSQNPEFYKTILLSNPSIQKLSQNNPDILHALSDPSTLRQLLTAATSPTAHAELLRGQDRAISNLENIPEGFQYLRKMYSSIQEPLLEDLVYKNSPSKVKEPTFGQSNGFVTKEPIPNPWNSKRPLSAPLKSTYRVNESKLFNGGTHSLLSSTPSDPLPLSDLKTKFSKELTLLNEMGFTDDEENLTALIATNGHIQASIDRILSQRSDKNK